MRQGKIWPFFLIALFCQCFLTGVGILAFAPFLAIVYNRQAFIPSLWTAALTGLIVDLLSASLPFGIHALNYTLTTALLYRYRHYFVDKPIGLALFTGVFSLLSTTFRCLLLLLFGSDLPLNPLGLATDFLLMPLLDGLYALLCFSFSILLYQFLRKQWFRFLFFKKETKKKSEETANP